MTHQTRLLNMKQKLLFLSVLLTFNAYAQDAATTQTPVEKKSEFIQQTDSALSEEMQLDGRLKKLEKQAQILQKENEIAKLAPGINGSAYGIPYVKAVEGIDKKYTALIIFGNGVEYESVAGDTLPNGMKVTRVAPGDVRVRSGKTDYRLGFINPSQVPSMDASAGMGSQNGVPSVPRY